MLECKLCGSSSVRTHGFRINRYMLECKLCNAVGTISNVTELIDTCWNVNRLMHLTKCGVSGELIDTCWNVNGRPST